MSTLASYCKVYLKDYPLYSQESKKDPTIWVKLYDSCSNAKWYITEYDPITKEAFWYVSCLVWNWECDEWGYISISELDSLFFEMDFMSEPYALKIKRIFPDEKFKPTKFSKIKIPE